MLYLTRFTFPDADAEFDFRLTVKRTCYDTLYPFGVLSARGAAELEFEPVTLLYGGNGSGKTTALNVIAERLRLARDTLYNRSNLQAVPLRPQGTAAVLQPHHYQRRRVRLYAQPAAHQSGRGPAARGDVRGIPGE